LSATESNNAQVLLMNGWIVRVRKPESGKSSRIILMMHGLSGTEESMTIFTRNLPRDSWIFAPRAPIALESGGYKWINHSQGMQASYAEFLDAGEKLHSAFEQWKTDFNLESTGVDVIGFSQGAVIAAAYLLTYPGEVNRTGFLSGFLPADTPDFIPAGHLKGKTIFLAHGSQDPTVPIERAQQTAAWFENWGAQVIFCEAPVGHRLSANCFRGFADYFRNPD